MLLISVFALPARNLPVLIWVLIYVPILALPLWMSLLPPHLALLLVKTSRWQVLMVPFLLSVLSRLPKSPLVASSSLWTPPSTPSASPAPLAWMRSLTR